MLSHHSRRPKTPGALHNLGGSETLRSAPICRDWGGHPVFAATFGVSLIAFRDNLGSGLELVAEKLGKHLIVVTLGYGLNILVINAGN
jgi:hypothetical protein